MSQYAVEVNALYGILECPLSAFINTSRGLFHDAALPVAFCIGFCRIFREKKIELGSDIMGVEKGGVFVVVSASS